MYRDLGVRTVINGQFPLTRLGGSVLPKEVQEAMVDSTLHWCSVWELEEKAGAAIAEICGAEAAHVTCGAFAALVLSAAACIAGRDPEKMNRLPDTSGMKNEIIIQAGLRGTHPGEPTMYDRSMEVPGGRFVEIGGGDSGATPAELEAAIGSRTAAIHFMVPPGPEHGSGIVPLEQVIEIGHAHQVPIIVDAAGQTYPVNLLRKFTGMGADLVCYAAKYVHGANSAGWVCGRRDLVETVALHSFIGQEAGGRDPRPGYYKSIGRGYKLDRQEIVGTVVALRRWVNMDHQKERVEPAMVRIRKMQDELSGIPNLNFDVYPEHRVEGTGYHQLGLQITFEGKSAREVVEMDRKLRSGNPSIWVYVRGNALQVNALLLGPGDETMITERIKELLGS